jgi:hypothetical protein
MEVRLLGSACHKADHTVRKHVLEDLEPYICTFEGCSSPLKTFSRRRDFVQHEMNVHGRSDRSLYFCLLPECGARLESYSSVLKHQVDCHANQIESLHEFDPEYVPSLIERSGAKRA